MMDSSGLHKILYWRPRQWLRSCRSVEFGAGHIAQRRTIHRFQRTFAKWAIFWLTWTPWWPARMRDIEMWLRFLHSNCFLVPFIAVAIDIIVLFCQIIWNLSIEDKYVVEIWDLSVWSDLSDTFILWFSKRFYQRAYGKSAKINLDGLQLERHADWIFSNYIDKSSSTELRSSSTERLYTHKSKPAQSAAKDACSMFILLQICQVNGSIEKSERYRN